MKFDDVKIIRHKYDALNHLIESLTYLDREIERAATPACEDGLLLGRYFSTRDGVCVSVEDDVNIQVLGILRTSLLTEIKKVTSWFLERGVEIPPEYTNL